MKLGPRPGDLVVEELNNLTPSGDGPFRVYQLWKRGLSTLEVIDILHRRYRMDQRDICVCGLKDKHAESTQLISCRRDLSLDSGDPRWKLQLVGRHNEPLGSEHMRGNRFSLVVRDLDPPTMDRVKRQLPDARRGVPNWFDSQRFGSVRHGRGWVAERLIRGDFEGACRLVMATFSPQDSAGMKARKRQIAEKWGHWDELDKKLGRGDETPLIRHLARHPDEFAAAFMKVNRRMRAMFVFAFQSYIWNLTVARLIENAGCAARRARYTGGWLTFFDRTCGSIERWQNKNVPLVKYNTSFEGAQDVGEAVTHALKRFDLTQREMRIRLKGVFFKEHPRPMLLRPDELDWEPMGDDDMHKGRLHGRLTVSVPSGSYATVIVKRLFGAREIPADVASASASPGPEDGYDLVDSFGIDADGDWGSD